MIKLNGDQRDALGEIINIASGHAATALSQMLNKTVDMGVPTVGIKKFEEVSKRLGEDDEVVIATLINVLEGLSGSVLMIVKEKKSKEIASTLLSGMMAEYDEAMLLSVFQEIGNILGNSYLNAMGDFLGLKMYSSVPFITVDMLFPIISSAYINANQDEDYILDIECTLTENDIEFDMNVFFILPPEALQIIIDSINKMMGIE